MNVNTVPDRHFIPQHLEITDWKTIEPYYQDLEEREINSFEDLYKWMEDRSELDSAVSEEYRWRYIRRTCETDNESYNNQFQDFVENISPQLMQISNVLDKKIYECPYLDLLDNQRFLVFKRNLKNRIELFNDRNIPLSTKLQLKVREYGNIAGKMSIEHEGQSLTLPQARKLLQSSDRQKRKAVFEAIAERRMEDKDTLNALFEELLSIRQEMAANAGFDNFRDYKLRKMGRFDYGVKECEQFHESVKKSVLPLVERIYKERKNVMGVASLRPYDLEVSLDGEDPLVPFKSADDLVDKTISCLSQVDPFFGECLNTMKEMGHLDLDSRMGKAPGGYNMTMPEIGVPFIFMNAAGTVQDVRTMIHEGGHAVHSFLSRNLEFLFDKELTSEVAELASMSMELLALDHHDAFYDKTRDIHCARRVQLENTVILLPWIAAIDKFQHWLYTHVGHSLEERESAWNEIMDEFSPSVVDWTGYEEYKTHSWQKQLHIFQVPFYYIEYGIAQLGSIAVWRNYCKDPGKALGRYKEALGLGYSRTIPEIYRAAGVPFDFSTSYIQELMQFIADELDRLPVKG